MIDWTTALQVAGGLAGYLGTAVMGALWQYALRQRDTARGEAKDLQVVIAALQDEAQRAKEVSRVQSQEAVAEDERLRAVLDQGPRGSHDLVGVAFDGLRSPADRGGDAAVPGSGAANVPGPGPAKPVP